jgi:hypothetical protein
MGVSLRWFGGVLMIVGSVGCSQSGVGSLNSPAAPSSLAAGPLGSSSELGEFTTRAGPGASYNATGSWHLVISERPHGDAFPIGDVDLTQHSDGTITFRDDTATFTFTPRGSGTGRIIPYDLSAFGPIVLPNSPCETRLSGTAMLDTQTDTITVPRVSGVEDDCENVSVSATFTRN